MLCLVGKCGKIVIFAIFAKFASIANFYGPHHCFQLCFALLANVAKLSFSPYLLNSPVSPTFMGPLIALCFTMLAIVAILSFSPYLPNLPVSPTFMAPLISLCFALLANVAKLSFSPYLPNSPVSPILWAPSLLCALPCWRLWQNCHFRHICQIRQYVLFFAIFVVACISGHICGQNAPEIIP